MSKIYVNGYVLPTLPTECGSTEYPYSYISLSGSHFYLFALSAKGSIRNEDPSIYEIPEGTTVKYKMWITAYNSSKAEESQETYPGITATNWMLHPTLNDHYSNAFPTNNSIKWSNHEITYTDGTPYMDRSDSTNLNLICGDNATWDFNNYNTLIISGTGSTYDYNYQEENYPWSLLKENIAYIKINEGITRLGNANFHGLKLSSISTSNFPTTLTEIGKRCFGGCYTISSISLSETIEKIDEFAFAQCGFSSLWLPTSLKELGSSVFQATPLQSIYINSSNEYFTTFEGALFNKDLTTIILFPQKSNHINYTIPEGVTKIDDSCFYGHNKLQTIICPSTLTEIGFGAFGYMEQLINIIIPAEVNYIDTIAFCEIPTLEWIKFLSSTPCDINTDAIELNTCPNLTRIYVPVGCAESYQTAEDWLAYKHLIYESKSTEFDLNKLIIGFTYGLTGQPLPIPAEVFSYLLSENEKVLKIISVNNVNIYPHILEVI